MPFRKTNDPRMYTYKQVLAKSMKFCAYQERYQDELRLKLSQLNVSQNIIEEVITTLIEQNFLNEERYAIAFCRGKHNQKAWGKRKIIHALRHKGISEACIQIGMSYIDETYEQSLHELCSKKAVQIKEKNPAMYRKKLANFLISKGYEPELVWDLVKNYPK